MNIKTANSCRIKGEIPKALEYGKICNNIYTQNIEPVCKC